MSTYNELENLDSVELLILQKKITEIIEKRLSPKKCTCDRCMASASDKVANDILLKLKKIVAEQLQVRGDEIKLDSDFKDDLGADSLDLVELMIAIENKFEIEIPDHEVEDIKTVQGALNYIKSRLNEKLCKK